MKAGDALIHVPKKQAEGELAVHKANIEVYRTMPAGIGEHADITEAVIAELDKNEYSTRSFGYDRKIFFR